ncbi:DUF3794 domain-containing protein [Clostridium sporogenes]|uniref:DUF3794 domain-containing protein n=1 Tax=Clostridium TaxID=1485 RepID=UPI000E05F980|nr:DUF3794 domain-containing protein [Clostridium sporogenes]MCW6087625.1 hypothetical protein [Clostridium sporogenes]NFV12498.1 hypothetical protein [Clostridium sporogenes]STC74982.1 Cna B-type domain-containing protein [Clostridium botulinum]
MAKIMRNLVEYIGIADSLPTNPKYFKELTVQEDLVIPMQKPDIEQLLGVMVEAEVISTRLIETEKGISDEGQNLSGCKLIIELKLHEKVKYVADEPTQSVHVAEYESQYKSVFVVVPCEINGTDVCELVRRNKMSVNVYIEDIYAEMVDCRNIFKNITLLVDVMVRS